MTRTVDTAGQCCWPGQAWSSSKARCVGKATCPAAMTAKGETCMVVATSTTPTQPAARSPTSFKLDATQYAPDAPISIKFPAPMSSQPNSRAWVTIIGAGTPPSMYGSWEYIVDGATSAKLVAPKAPGAYEVRLHTDYPTKSFNVVHSVKLAVDTSATRALATSFRFQVRPRTVAPGGSVEILFAQVMDAAPGERFWVTVVKPDAAPTSYAKYEYVPAGAETMPFAVPSELGEYEIRLHANYPRLSTNLVHRVKIRVGD